MNINTMTFVAPNLACGKARGGRIPHKRVYNRRSTQPQAKFAATRRAAVLFRPDFVARSLQIHCGICSSLTPRLAEKSLAANVIVFMFMTTKHPSEDTNFYERDHLRKNHHPRDQGRHRL